MKKLMMFAAVAMSAVVASAAQFEWSASQIRNGWGDGASKIDGTAYLFLVGGEVSASSIASAISGAADTTTLATTLSGKSIDSAAVSGGLIEGKTPEGISATAPADLFFVVISGDNVYQSGVEQLTEIQTIGSTSLAFGSQKSATQAASAWKTVGGGGTDPLPEPTSGLLLLVGGAMLALRRKQK